MLTMNTSMSDLLWKLKIHDESDILYQCVTDSKLFAKYAVEIQNPSQGWIPFTPHQHQLDLLDLLTNHQHLAVKSSRQVGTTTTVIVHMLWGMICNPNTTVAYITKRSEEAERIVDFTYSVFQRLKHVSTTSVKKTPKTIEYSNGSRFVCVPLNKISSLRGTSLNTLALDRTYGDEDLWTDLIEALLPTINATPLTKVLELMPIGASGLIEGMYECSIPWNVMPGRDSTFKDQMIKLIGEEAWSLEYGD